MKSRRTRDSALHGSGGRPRGPRGPGPGYTLLELLVAMTILIMLGSGLVALLKQGITTWHTAEKRGAIHERAQMVLDQIAEDLRAAAGDSRAEGTGFWVRFLCDTDRGGRPRLRFTRAISAEAQDPIARQGGKYVETGPGARYDLHDDAREAREGRLLAPAGYCEVIYALDPDPEKNVLWRGLRSPIGGAGSLFIDRNVEAEAGSKKTQKKSAASGADQPAPGVALAEGKTAARKGGRKAVPGSPAEEPAEETPLERAARPFAEGILHLSFSFWTPYTDTWDRSLPPRLRRSPNERSGPIATWDSTRAVLDEKAPPSEFAWRRVEGSLEDPSDDLFPERVEVTLVVAGNAELPLLTLVEDLGASDRSILLSRANGLSEEGPNRFVKIDGEWIAYEKIDRGRLILPVGKATGRGARGTAPARHQAGAVVEVGTTFRRVVEIPAVRIDNAPPPEEKRRRP
jgi:type II secretory pathway pseudopilin PulG